MERLSDRDSGQDKVLRFLLITAKTERNTPEKKEEHPKGKKRVELNCFRPEFNT